jgi:hypothetical protein
MKPRAPVTQVLMAEQMAAMSPGQPIATASAFFLDRVF